jgi:hypothetical protein
MNPMIEMIDNYLQMGGMFNPEMMEHHKVRDMLLKCREEMERLITKCDKQAFVLQRIYAEHLPDTWFVAGEGGEKDRNNLPKYVHVCPAYGCDWVQIYERTDRTSGPEW